MSRPWTIVLAAGSGRRLASLTGGVPKQYWSGPGGRSLLADTLQRFASVSERARTVVIADASHRGYLGDANRFCGTVVYQPRDRGTAAGVLLSLSPVLSTDPDSIVIITPSDHGIENTAVFLEGIRAAVDAVRATDEIIVFGVEPASACDDYGWILPGRDSHSRFRPIAWFIEKPDRIVAEQLLRSGAAWNTMVVVTRARRLRDLCFHFVPPLQAVFGAALRERGSGRKGALDRAYATLPHYDFSRDVLSQARTLSTYIWPAGIGWSDLGTPERMIAWQDRGRSAVAAVPA